MTILLVLLSVHFVSDFLMQSDWMAQYKSTRWDALTAHVAVYTAPFFFFGWQFALITFALHFVTDAVTSRITSRLWFLQINSSGDMTRNWAMSRPFAMARDWEWKETYFVRDTGTRHWFFVVIGADQLIHAYALAFAWMVTH